jgi:hypothetical protein
VDLSGRVIHLSGAGAVWRRGGPWPRTVRDVQDFVGHRDARTTRRHDRAREDLDRSPTYALARWLTAHGERPQG